MTQQTTKRRSASRPVAPVPAGAGGHRFLYAMVALLALAVRLLHLLEYCRLPWFSVLQMDGLYHAEWAERLVAHGWNDPEVFFRAPLYPYLLALLRSLTGELLWSARLLQILLGVATVVLATAMAERLLSRPWAWACGIALALQWSPIHHETELLLEPVLTFWTTLLLFLMVSACAGGVRGRTLFVWGLISGIATVTRPNFALFVPLLVLHALLLDGAPSGGARAFFRTLADGRNRLRSRSLQIVLLVAAGFLLPILPVWLHNARRGDPETPVAWQGGINLYIGNNSSANGWSAVAPGMRADWRGGFEDALRLAQEGSGSSVKLRPSQVSNYWAGEATRFWRDHPIQAIGLTLRKLRLFWGATEIKNNEDPEYFRATLWSLRWLPVSFGLLAPPGLLGMVLAWRRGRKARLLLGFTLCWMLSILPFFICARYRLPVAILMPIFAFSALEAGWKWIRQRRWRILVPAVCGCGLMALLLAGDPAGARLGGFFQSYFNLGDVLSELGRLPEAEGAYRRAIRLDPQYANSYNNLGRALERMRRPADAEAAYRQGLAVRPGHPQLRRNLALVLEAEGKLSEAAEVFANMVQEFPQGWDCWFFLGRIQEALRQGEAATGSYRRGLALMPSATIPRAHLARLVAAQGDTTAARLLLDEGLRLAPGDRGLTALSDSLQRRRGIRN